MWPQWGQVNTDSRIAAVMSTSRVGGLVWSWIWFVLERSLLLILEDLWRSLPAQSGPRTLSHQLTIFNLHCRADRRSNLVVSMETSGINPYMDSTWVDLNGLVSEVFAKETLFCVNPAVAEDRVPNIIPDEVIVLNFVFEQAPKRPIIQV
jgi:hypothetical protein